MFTMALKNALENGLYATLLTVVMTSVCTLQGKQFQIQFYEAQLI